MTKRIGGWISGIMLISALTSCRTPRQTNWVAVEKAVIEGFDIPEAVKVDTATGTPYVSNIVAARDGEGVDRFWADDGSGFVSRLQPGSGKVDELKWRRSTDALKLNSLKGMCVKDDLLWIADNSRIVRFALKEEGKGDRIDVEGAERMNDMVTDGKDVYVSDTAVGCVYRLTAAGHDVIKAPKAVNGITFAGDEMLAVSWDLHDLYTIDLSGKEDPKPFGLSEHFTNLDGIEALDDGSILVSDFNGNKISIVSPDRKTVRTLIEVETPADIGIDRRRMLLYVPMFMKGRVAIYNLKKE